MGTVKKITMHDTLQLQRMRKVQELLQHKVLTFKDLHAICPRDDQRADLVARMLAGGLMDATFYPKPLPNQEVANG
jgi:hypothetical protein